MRRAVLDSSVLVSAFLTPHGVSAKLLDAAEQQLVRLCISREILDETRRSLRTKVKRIRRCYAYSDGRIDLFIEGLVAGAEMVRDLPQIRVVPLDPKDDVIVAAAVKAKADFLVTGDRHLLSLGSASGHSNPLSPRVSRYALIGKQQARRSTNDGSRRVPGVHRQRAGAGERMALRAGRRDRLASP